MDLLFRRLIILQPVLFVILGCSVFLEQTDPSLIQMIELDDGIIFQNFTFLMYFLIFIILIYIFSLVLLYNFYSIGRIFFLIIILCDCIIIIDSGYEGESSPSALISNFYTMLDGVLIYLMFFSTLKDKFKKKLFK